MEGSIDKESQVEIVNNNWSHIKMAAMPILIVRAGVRQVHGSEPSAAMIHKNLKEKRAQTRKVHGCTVGIVNNET